MSEAEKKNPGSKSILQYIPVLWVTLPIRWKIGDTMYEWVWCMYCFNQKGSRCSHKTVKIGNPTYWFRMDKNTFPLTFPLHYLPWYLIKSGKYRGCADIQKNHTPSFVFSSIKCISWSVNLTCSTSNLTLANTEGRYIFKYW